MRSELIEVRVTEKHIRDGMKKSTTTCPVALAVRELFNPTKDVAVTLESCRIDTDIYVLPLWVKMWIRSFDDSQVVETINFTLENKVEEC